MSNDWRVDIEYRPDQIRTFLYIHRKVDTDIRQFLTKGGSEIETVKASDVKKNEVHFASFEDDHIMSLIVQAWDKQGIKAPAQSYIEGKYEATSEHLQDLRKLIPRLTPTTKRGEPQTNQERIT